MIWLVGNKGMLGHEVETLLASAGTDLVVSDLDVNITDSEAVNRFVMGKPITWIVNCAAYTAVDKAESEPDRAMSINRDGPENLAECATGIGARILNISTDYVFDGQKLGPYEETDRPNPQCVYGETKLAGEVAVSKNPGHVILRTSWLYGVSGPNFVSTMLRLMDERDELGIVDDQRGSPTYAGDLAKAAKAVIDHRNPPPGVYHFSNDGETTWFGFAREIYEQALRMGLLNSECQIRPISTSEYPTPAKRPENSVLDKTRIRSELGIELSPWQDSLKHYLQQVMSKRGGNV